MPNIKGRSRMHQRLDLVVKENSVKHDTTMIQVLVPGITGPDSSFVRNKLLSILWEGKIMKLNGLVKTTTIKTVEESSTSKRLHNMCLTCLVPEHINRKTTK